MFPTYVASPHCRGHSFPSPTLASLCHSDHASPKATANKTACLVTSSPINQQLKCVSTLKTGSSHDFILAGCIILLPVIHGRKCAATVATSIRQPRQQCPLAGREDLDRAHAAFRCKARTARRMVTLLCSCDIAPPFLLPHCDRHTRVALSPLI